MVLVLVGASAEFGRRRPLRRVAATLNECEGNKQRSHTKQKSRAGQREKKRLRFQGAQEERARWSWGPASSQTSG